VSYISDVALSRVPAIFAFLGVLLLIAIGIVFDIVGTAVAAGEQPPLNAMAAKRINGARQALYLVKNADKVSNFTNDVIGDVTGAVSGAAGMTVALEAVQAFHGGPLIVTLSRLMMVGLIAFLVVGGKAAGKTFALDRPTQVVFLAGRVIYGFERVIGRSVTGGRGPNASRRRTT
jgi:CBS domain containing-hemolysin-like protein